jgi:hypothetical protein
LHNNHSFNYKPNAFLFVPSHGNAPNEFSVENSKTNVRPRYCLNPPSPLALSIGCPYLHHNLIHPSTATPSIIPHGHFKLRTPSRASMGRFGVIGPNPPPPLVFSIGRPYHHHPTKDRGRLVVAVKSSYGHLQSRFRFLVQLYTLSDLRPHNGLRWQHNEAGIVL